MDQTNVTGYRHRRSTSSDRFISVFSRPPPPPSASAAVIAGDELDEVDVLYSDDFSSPRSAAASRRFRHSFPKPERFGILAALPEDHRGGDLGRDIPSIPKPEAVPIRRLQQSAPVRIPMMARKAAVDDVDGGDDEEEVVPPHEMVARGWMRDRTTTFSVVEGVGRTLKGRDLRQVRNAVWRQTGFLD